jgi:hypothetical protein
VRDTALGGVDAPPPVLLLTTSPVAAATNAGPAKIVALLEHDPQVAEQRRDRAVSPEPVTTAMLGTGREPRELLHVVGRVGMARQRIARAARRRRRASMISGTRSCCAMRA